jgi:hypothetical protein
MKRYYEFLSQDVHAEAHLVNEDAPPRPCTSAGPFVLGILSLVAGIGLCGLGLLVICLALLASLFPRGTGQLEQIVAGAGLCFITLGGGLCAVGTAFLRRGAI